MTEPAAFLSYARFDDRHHDGLISDLRARLSAEVRVQTGRDFPIFQDREDITWGQNWQSRIDEALDAVTLLLPVVTPGFFRSRACRGEVERFLARERALGRRDLILPIYFVSAPEFEDEGRREADDLARELWTRQFADWRELRFEPLTAPAARRAVAALAAQIHSDRSVALVMSPPGVTPSRLPPAVRPLRRPAEPEPPTHVVDAYGRGGFTTIGAALAAAGIGDRILVRPALYQEQLVIDKPVELLGDGPREDIEIHARGGSAVLFRAAIGRVAGLTLRQVDARDRYFYCVVIDTGRLDLEGCDISSGYVCVGVHGGAAPRVRGNKIHEGELGVFLYDHGLGLIEDNDITGNALSGVSIMTGANPILRRNHIYGSGGDGIYVSSNGLGLIEDNDISDNAVAGVQIKTGANPTLRGNHIHGSHQNGILVDDDGLGLIEDNDITANTPQGVAIRNGARPVLRRNRVNRNAGWGVWVYGRGAGTVEDNDLSDNQQGAMEIDTTSTELVTSARNKT